MFALFWLDEDIPSHHHVRSLLQIIYERPTFEGAKARFDNSIGQPYNMSSGSSLRFHEYTGTAWLRRLSKYRLAPGLEYRNRPHEHLLLCRKGRYEYTPSNDLHLKFSFLS